METTGERERPWNFFSLGQILKKKNSFQFKKNEILKKFDP